MSDHTDALRGLADDVATLKAELLPVVSGPSIAALLASIEQRVSTFPQPLPAPDRPKPATKSAEVPKTTVKSPRKQES